MQQSGRVRVKFCGITRIEDATAAAALGVDAIGFVFHPQSPRWISPAVAAAIGRQVPPFVCKVGLFVDAEVDTVRRVTEEAGIELIQYHGDEPPEQCVAARIPFIKAVRMAAGVDLGALCRRYAAAAALLLDAYDPGVPGGTGMRFDWTRVPRGLPKPLILAGGLTAENVARAVRQVAPYAVDVSGGIETAKGIKDVGRMRAFLQQVKTIDG